MAALVGLLGRLVVPVPLPDVDGGEVEAPVGELLELARGLGSGDPFLRPLAGVLVDREDRAGASVVFPVTAGGVDFPLVREEVGHVARKCGA